MLQIPHLPLYTLPYVRDTIPGCCYRAAQCFEFYGDDILNGKIDDVPDLTQDVEKSILAEELKMSCTNVMLQCLDVESRCIFILGTVKSKWAGEIRWF